MPDWGQPPFRPGTHVLAGASGVCHTYLHDDAELEMALAICENAKCQRPATCNAMETLLVARAAAERLLPSIAARLLARGVVLHGCPETCRLVPQASPAGDRTYDTEYLELALSVRVVEGLEGALEHIARAWRLGYHADEHAAEVKVRGGFGCSPRWSSTVGHARERSALLGAHRRSSVAEAASRAPVRQMEVTD